MQLTNWRATVVTGFALCQTLGVHTSQMQGQVHFPFYFFLVLPVYCYQPISLHPHTYMLSHVTPWTAACQAPLSMDFSRQEYWSGLPFPSPAFPILKTGKLSVLFTLAAHVHWNSHISGIYF